MEGDDGEELAVASLEVEMGDHGRQVGASSTSTSSVLNTSPSSSQDLITPRWAVGPSSPSFAHASLWEGCVERFRAEADQRATQLVREQQQSRKEILDKLQEVIRLCREATMNINCALNPPDKLADELVAKMRIGSSASGKAAQPGVQKVKTIAKATTKKKKASIFPQQLHGATSTPGALVRFLHKRHAGEERRPVDDLLVELDELVGACTTTPSTQQQGDP